MNINQATIELYRLDIYRLATMVLSHNQLNKEANFKLLNDDFFELEAFRLLVTVATLSRQILESETGIDEDGFAYCGDDELTFKNSLHKIIHAKTYALDNYFDVQDGKDSGDINIRVEAFRHGGSREVEIHTVFMEKFLNNCIILSNHLTRSN